MAKLTKKQQLFACEYLIDLNATQSAIRAGYSEKTVTEQGTRLLTNVKVKSYIEEKLKELESEKIAKADEVLTYLTAVMRGEEQEETIVVEEQGDGMSEARKIKKDVAPKDRIKAAELLGKRYSLFTDKVETKVDIKPIVITGECGLID